MKAALYVRVSSDMQKDNYSIPAQLNELRDYCVNYSPLIEAGASWSIFATEQVYPGSTGSPFPDK